MYTNSYSSHSFNLCESSFHSLATPRQFYSVPITHLHLEFITFLFEKMTFRIQQVAFAILTISTSIMATPWATRHASVCPASCIVTTTVTVVSTLAPTNTSSLVNTGTTDTSVVIIEPSTVQTTTSSPVQPSVSPITAPNNCNHNNCLRQFLRHPQVSAFCATYTTTINTETTSLPTYVSQCHADPTQISSACSCVVTGGVIPATPIVDSTGTGQQTQTGDGTVTTVTSSSPAPTTTDGGDMCMASIIYETFTQTTTYLVTIVGSSTSMSNSTEVAITTSSSTLSSDVLTLTTAASTSSII